MANPSMIGGGRYSRGENTGDTRRLAVSHVSAGAMLRRLWSYLGRNRRLLVLAILLSVSSSLRWRSAFRSGDTKLPLPGTE